MLVGGGDGRVGRGLGKARSTERREQASQRPWLQGALGSHTGTRSCGAAPQSPEWWKIPDGAARFGILVWEQREVTEKRKSIAPGVRHYGLSKSSAICSQGDLGRVELLNLGTSVFFCKAQVISPALPISCMWHVSEQRTWLL